MTKIQLEPHLTKLFINNEYVDCQNPKRLSVYNPATEELVSDQIPVAGPKDVDAAVDAATKAFLPGSPWRATTGLQRQAILNKFADLLDAQRDRLAKLTRVTLGAPYLPFGKGELDIAINCFRYYAGWADKFPGQSFPADDGVVKIVKNEPLGVVAGIIPWNSPLASTALKAAPALATGNVFIIKPSEKTPFATAEIGRLIIEAGFPPGVFQILQGDGTTGELLSRHMKVSKISFTGSISTGKAIQVMAAQSNLKRVTLELGGKSPAVVFDDANLENAVNWCVNSLMADTGQTCFAATRVYAQEGIYQQFLEAYKAGIEERSKAVGDPEDKSSQHGPVVDKSQYERIMHAIDTANQTKAGDLITGGKRKGDRGYYIEPTIFADTVSDAVVYREEIFGPVAVVNKFKTEAEIIERSNDSKYGLMAGVFTQDIQRAMRVSSAIDSGVVGINCISYIHNSCPFGGTKQSGIGRELGEHALRAYTEPKSIFINLNY